MRTNTTSQASANDILWRANEFIGVNVVDANGEDLGSVEDDVEEREARLGRILETEEALVRIGSGPVNQLLVWLAPGLSDEEMLDLIARLSQNPDVDWANPVVIPNFAAALIFCRYCASLPLSVQVHFTAVFPASVAVGDIDALNAAYGMGV